MKFLGNLFRKKDKKAEPKRQYGVPLSPSRDYSSDTTLGLLYMSSVQPDQSPSSDSYSAPSTDWSGGGGLSGGGGASGSWDSGCDTSSSYSDSGSSDSGSCSSSD